MYSSCLWRPTAGQRWRAPGWYWISKRSIVYTPNIKRNRVPFFDFETGFPKTKIPPPTIATPFTVSKQQRLREMMKSNPQLTFKGRVVRQLSCHRISLAGRNNEGKITSRHRGTRHVQRLRFIDFKRGRKDIYAVVLR
eukprot:GHVQ01026643.1.p1 GENE.GHVQ01026643.1~~GHVQ01026643.1.p1  ORF type:complete len:138 (+),score=8.93 GHVQ01026643.1:436-849(+)